MPFDVSTRYLSYISLSNIPRLTEASTIWETTPPPSPSRRSSTIRRGRSGVPTRCISGPLSSSCWWWSLSYAGVKNAIRLNSKQIINRTPPHPAACAVWDAGVFRFEEIMPEVSLLLAALACGEQHSQCAAADGQQANQQSQREAVCRQLAVLMAQSK